jgi:hypothetical protein
MKIPGFNADASLPRSTKTYRSSGHYGHGQSVNSGGDTVIPAIPFCGNCDDILDRCAQNGGRPRAVCNACATGNCFSGVEDPTPSDPFTPKPWQW